MSSCYGLCTERVLLTACKEVQESSTAFVELHCNISRQHATLLNSTAGAQARNQVEQEDAGVELFREFAVAPEDVFGDDVHIPDVAGEVVEDNALIIDQAAQQRKDSPALTTSSLTFRCGLPAISKASCAMPMSHGACGVSASRSGNSLGGDHHVKQKVGDLIHEVPVATNACL